MRAFATLLAVLVMATAPQARAAPGWAIAVHGGAGAVSPGDLTPAQEAAYRQAMTDAAQAGGTVLAAGGSALDAVEAVVRRMEDDPLFNAGRGAVFTAEGRNELDAAIMDGSTRAAGAVAGLTRTRHPISLAREVMTHSPHVMLVGEGAEAFARSRGVEAVDPAFFFTEIRWRALTRKLDDEGLPVPPRPRGAPRAGDARADLVHDEGKHGTVGVVALDGAGRLAAGTSTGGLTGKRWGRVGDTPIIGAGVYADAACAVSATGTGEYFIRLAAAHEVCALVRLKGLGLQAALDQVVQDELADLGGDGGLIAVTPDGQPAWSFNTTGMYRASLGRDRPLTVGIYRQDP